METARFRTRRQQIEDDAAGLAAAIANVTGATSSGNADNEDDAAAATAAADAVAAAAAAEASVASMETLASLEAFALCVGDHIDRQRLRGLIADQKTLQRLRTGGAPFVDSDYILSTGGVFDSVWSEGTTTTTTTTATPDSTATPHPQDGYRYSALRRIYERGEFAVAFATAIGLDCPSGRAFALAAIDQRELIWRLIERDASSTARVSGISRGGLRETTPAPPPPQPPSYASYGARPKVERKSRRRAAAAANDDTGRSTRSQPSPTMSLPADRYGYGQYDAIPIPLVIDEDLDDDDVAGAAAAIRGSVC
jgi:hypothetical protein